jgi:hypothetical protein
MSMAGASQRIAEIEFDPVRIKQQFVAFVRCAADSGVVRTS